MLGALLKSSLLLFLRAASSTAALLESSKQHCYFFCSCLLPQMRSCSLVTEFAACRPRGVRGVIVVCFPALDAVFPLIPLCLCDRLQGFFTNLLMAAGSECTSNGLYCFSGTPGEDAFEVYDPNADDKWSSLYGVDTRYGGGAGVAGAFSPSLILSLLALYFSGPPAMAQLSEQNVFSPRKDAF